LAINTVRRGMAELADPMVAVAGVERVRSVGGGRKALTERQPELLGALERLVSPHTRGDPMRPLLWTCKSVRRLAGELNQAGYAISPAKTAELLHQLGLPRALRRMLSDKAPLAPPAGRVFRFDFHLTTQGWRISEANSDVPGGYSEASHFTALMAEHFPRLRPAGDPAGAWASALADAAGPGSVVALLSAPGLVEDHQVVAFLAAKLRERGCRAYLAKPEQIIWRRGIAHLEGAWYRGPVAALVRFYQAEWLVRLERSCEWRRFIRGGQTPVANPGLAAITESKRFPLLWEQLSTPLPAWRALLPETRDPRDVDWASDEGWVLKPAFGRVGEGIGLRGCTSARDWTAIVRDVRRRPDGWVAQRRFSTVLML
jgi:hypothetical protein